MHRYHFLEVIGVDGSLPGSDSPTLMKNIGRRFGVQSASDAPGIDCAEFLPSEILVVDPEMQAVRLNGCGELFLDAVSWKVYANFIWPYSESVRMHWGVFVHREDVSKQFDRLLDFVAELDGCSDASELHAVLEKYGVVETWETPCLGRWRDTRALLCRSSMAVAEYLRTVDARGKHLVVRYPGVEL